jgi:hypothetical protein
MCLLLYVTTATGGLQGRFILAEMGAMAVFFEDAAGGEAGDSRS